MLFPFDLKNLPSLTDKETKPKYTRKKVIQSFLWILYFWYSFLLPVIGLITLIVFIAFMILRWTEYTIYVLNDPPEDVPAWVFWMFCYQVISDIASFMQLYMPYSEKTWYARKKLIICMAVNRVIFAPVLVYFIRPRYELSTAAFLIILPFTCWPLNLYSYWSTSTDHLDSQAEKILASLIFNFSYTFMNCIRLWGLLGSLAIADAIATTNNWFTNIPLSTSLVRLVLYLTVRAYLRYAIVRGSKDEEAKSEHVIQNKRKSKSTKVHPLPEKIDIEKSKKVAIDSNDDLFDDDVDSDASKSVVDSVMSKIMEEVEANRNNSVESVMDDELSNLIFLSSVALFFSHYSLAGISSFYRIEMFSSFLTITIMRSVFEKLIYIYQLLLIRVKEQEIGIDDKVDIDLAKDMEESSPGSIGSPPMSLLSIVSGNQTDEVKRKHTFVNLHERANNIHRILSDMSLSDAGQERHSSEVHRPSEVGSDSKEHKYKWSHLKQNIDKSKSFASTPHPEISDRNPKSDKDDNKDSSEHMESHSSYSNTAHGHIHKQIHIAFEDGSGSSNLSHRPPHSEHDNWQGSESQLTSDERTSNQKSTHVPIAIEAQGETEPTNRKKSIKFAEPAHEVFEGGPILPTSSRRPTASSLQIGDMLVGRKGSILAKASEAIMRVTANTDYEAPGMPSLRRPSSMIVPPGFMTGTEDPALNTGLNDIESNRPTSAKVPPSFSSSKTTGTIASVLKTEEARSHIRRRYRRLAVTIRFDACSSLIAITSAWCFNVIFITPQPAYESCNHLQFSTTFDASMRFLIAATIDVLLYCMIFWFMKFHTHVPLSFSTEITPNFVQGLLSSAFFCITVGCWLAAYERGMLESRSCSENTLYLSNFIA